MAGRVASGRGSLALPASSSASSTDFESLIGNKFSESLEPIVASMKGDFSTKCGSVGPQVVGGNTVLSEGPLFSAGT